MKISIIVPMYNAEKTIERTIESILNQTYTNYQVYLIDDGSQDRTRDECNRLVGDDRRFHYYYKENGGVSSARNLGIELAKEPYIAFLDSDDEFHPDFLISVLTEMEKDPKIDLVACSYIRNKKPIYLGNRILDNNEMVDHILDDESPLGYVCNKFYKASIFIDHQVRFDETVHYGEDLLFNITYLKYVRCVHYIAEILFYYNIGETSISSRLNHPKTLTHIDALEKVIEQVKESPVTDATLRKYQNTYDRITLGYLFRHNITMDAYKIKRFEQLTRQMEVFQTGNLLLSAKIVAGRAYVRLRKLQLKLFANK
ncbi:glycosyltransferase family 2 protein [Aerococcaceae bacterium WGS1372]